jgi:hypothetical protein
VKLLGEQFVARKGIISKKDSIVEGSLSVTSGISGDHIDLSNLSGGKLLTSINGKIVDSGYSLSVLDGVEGATFQELSDTPNYISGAEGKVLSISGDQIVYIDRTDITGSLETRITSLETFQSNLDATYATDTMVTSISEGLQTQIDNIDVTGDISTYVDPISASLQNQINNIDVTGDISTYVDPISASLQNQINNINSGLDDHLLENNIVADLQVGGVEAGDTVLAGSSLESVLNQLLTTTFFPTYTNGSAIFTENISNTQEIGQLVDITLSMNFNRGYIVGDLDNGIWNDQTVQNSYLGSANKYILDGQDQGLLSTLLLEDYQIIEGNQNWTGQVLYDQGPQALDSKNNPYDSPSVAGSLSDNTSNVKGTRRYFYGTETHTVIYTTSSEVRNSDSNPLNPVNGRTFTINVPLGAEMVVLAYPSNLRDLTSVVYVEGLGAEVKGIFSQTTVSVESSNAYDSINYRVYTYIPAEAFPSTATYNVTI